MAYSQPETDIIEGNRNGRGAIKGVGCIGPILILLMLLTAMAAKSVKTTEMAASISSGESEPINQDQLVKASPTPTAIRSLSINEAAATVVPTANVADLPTSEIEPTPQPTDDLRETTTPLSTATRAPEPEATLFIEQTSLEPDEPVAAILPTPTDNLSRTVKVPILMYHYISEPPENADKYRRDLSVPARVFRDQMSYLHDNGFSAIDLYDLLRATVNEVQLPEKPVVITVDDGYVDNYVNAYPILLEMGLSATFFLATGFIDDGNPNYMNWSMIEEMARSGMHIEPHSKSHPDLRGRERPFMIYEILGSQETIEAHIGQRPQFFAYPGGRYDDNAISILTELGYWGAVTTEGGNWHGYDDRYILPRIRIRNNTSISEFIDLVN